MTWDFALGLVVGVITSGGFWAGRGYERLRLIVAARSEKPAKVEPEPVPAAS
jgi:hypothetical protein